MNFSLSEKTLPVSAMARRYIIRSKIVPAVKNTDYRFIGKMVGKIFFCDNIFGKATVHAIASIEALLTEVFFSGIAIITFTARSVKSGGSDSLAQMQAVAAGP
jgi:hypothetical protein